MSGPIDNRPTTAPLVLRLFEFLSQEGDFGAISTIGLYCIHHSGTRQRYFTRSTRERHTDRTFHPFSRCLQFQQWEAHLLFPPCSVCLLMDYSVCWIQCGHILRRFQSSQGSIARGCPLQRAHHRLPSLSRTRASI